MVTNPVSYAYVYIILCIKISDASIVPLCIQYNDFSVSIPRPISHAHNYFELQLYIII